MKLKVGEIVELKELAGQKCIVTKIIEGGFGIVYFLKNTSPIMPYFVMKILKNNVNYKEIIREAVLWSKIGHHKNIASFICYGKLDNKFYILSHRYDKTLADINSISEIILKRIFIGIINGLNYAYKKVGLIHRDIKPNNIFLDKGFNPKIGDFGLSSYSKQNIQLSENFTQVDFHNTISKLGFGGTIPYMAPELFSKNAHITIQSDIYALGVTIFNLITNGAFPYLQPQFLTNNVSFKKFKISEINENIKNVILKCIDLDINERYNNYEEILNDLNTNETDIYVPSIGDVIDYIQTLRRSGQQYYAKKYTVNALNEYPNHPFLLNQLAIIEKEGNSINASIKLYENFLSKQFSYDKLLYTECIFNLIGFYFESKQFKSIVPFFNAYNGYYNDSLYIINEFIEYSIFLGFNKEYQKSYIGLYKYFSKHSYNDLHVLFILVISLKVNKINECIELIRMKKSKTVINILKLYNELDLDSFEIAIKDMEFEIFGGI